MSLVAMPALAFPTRPKLAKKLVANEHKEISKNSGTQLTLQASSGMYEYKKRMWNANEESSFWSRMFSCTLSFA